MKTIYVLTSKYLPLIANENFLQPSERALANQRIIHTQEITSDLIEKTFMESKNRMLAFNSKENAALAMGLGLKVNNTTPEFIDGEIPFFAVPVIFTVEVEDDFDLGEGERLTGTILHNYFETNSIPFFNASNEQGFWKDGIIHMMDNKINKLDTLPLVFSIDQAKLSHPIQASYLAANPVREADVNFATIQQDLEKIKTEELLPNTSPSCILF